MSINVGDKLPEATFTVMEEGGGPKQVSTSEVFGGKKVVLFGVPGAFTSTCSEQHLPGFLGHAEQIMAKGVDAIACTAVNDVFVLSAWAKDRDVDDVITMLADGNATFAKSIGLDIDLSPFGLGTRSKRYAMIVDDGTVKYIAIEDSPPEHKKATAANVVEAL